VRVCGTLPRWSFQCQVRQMQTLLGITKTRHYAKLDFYSVQLSQDFNGVLKKRELNNSQSDTIFLCAVAIIAAIL